MIFVLLRIMPILLPIVYLLSIKFFFIFESKWLWSLVAIILANCAFFSLLWFKKRGKKIFVFSFYSLIFTVLGFFEVWILSNQLFIKIFSLLWALGYGVLLESAFHYFYQTKKTVLFDLKNLISIFNAIVIFFFANLLFYLSIFNGFSFWFVLTVFSLVSWVILFCFFSVRDFDLRSIITYSSVISLILSEIMTAMFFWSASLLVSSFILTVLTYLLVSISVLILSHQVKTNLVVSYLIFTFLIIVAVLFTAQWV